MRRLFKTSNITLKSVILSWVICEFWGGENLSGEGEEQLGGVLGVDFDSGIFSSRSGLYSFGWGSFWQILLINIDQTNSLLAI